jgi:hypothetical protein
VIYDISHPYDLRVTLGKPTMTTAEVDCFLKDPDADPDIKRRLLVDVEQQGYPDPSSGRNPSLGQPDSEPSATRPRRWPS